MSLAPEGAQAGDVILRLTMIVVKLPDGTMGIEPILESADTTSISVMIATFMATADLLSGGEIGELIRCGLASKVAEGSDLDDELRKLIKEQK
jgi:hypothetical protein